MDVMNKPQALEGVDPSRIVDLDVREDLRNRRDPFQRIMGGKQALAHDGVLRIRAIFEPRPLYHVLGAEGFEHWTEQLGHEDWRVWFWRPGEEAAGAEEEADGTEGGAAGSEGGCGCGGKGHGHGHAYGGHAGAAPRSAGRRLPNCGNPRPDPTDLHLLDVRELEPPEPMVRTLEALAALPAGHTLVQRNARVPQFLLPELEKRGYSYTVREDAPGDVRVFIRHASEGQVLDVRLLPPREKHPTIFATFDQLAPGESFVILNDHDPAPLRYQFQGEREGQFTWAYLEEGPERWQVEIGRVG